ncbi:MAG TPA: hypothetical protein VFR85_17635, partial [Anaeromyxobacteraceae bacterium]|nr:hypothetical protein [Anaeromyxobacteraceae bacterium]
NTLIAPFSVPYDTNLNPGGGNRACTQSGVEYVRVTDEFGNLIDPTTPTIPCVYQGVQGAQFLTFPQGTYTFVVHGYRGSVEVHRGQGSLYVNPNFLNPITITADGLQNNLDVFLYQGVDLFQCFAGDTLGYTLVDFIGTTIDQLSGLACGNPIAFRLPSTGVDLDNLDIRVQVSDAGGVIFDSCTSQPFDHFGNDTGNFGWAVGLQTGQCPP